MGKATRRAPHQTFPWLVWVYGWCAGRSPSVLAHEVMCFCPCRATIELVQYAYPTRASNLRNPLHYPQSEINVHFLCPYSQYSIFLYLYISAPPSMRLDCGASVGKKFKKRGTEAKRGRLGGKFKAKTLRGQVLSAKPSGALRTRRFHWLFGAAGGAPIDAHRFWHTSLCVSALSGLQLN